jgi:hypothetical protein
VNSFDGLNVSGLVATLRASRNFESLFLGFLRSGIHIANAGTIHSNRFLSKNIFASFDARLKVDVAKSGRGREDRIIHAGDCESFLVGVESAEAFVFGNVEVLVPAFGLLGEEVGNGDDFSVNANVLGGFEEIATRATATSADANDNGINGRLGLGARDIRETDGCCSGSRNERGTLDELPARNR